MPDNDIREDLKKIIADQVKAQLAAKGAKAILLAERAAEQAES